VPKKHKRFRGFKFSPEIIREGVAAMDVEASSLEVSVADETTWTFDTDDEVDECFSMYRSKECTEGLLQFYAKKEAKRSLVVSFTNSGSSIFVKMEKRSDVERIFHIFERNLEASRIPQQELDAAKNRSLQIFIGHGRSPIWRELKDHLSEKHGYSVTAFETAPRGGQHIADILEDLEDDASFAIMVMTGENKSDVGTLHARENVIHETGLFQGVLGLRKVLVLLEKGCEEFSNRAGVQYIPFTKDNIKEVFGEVLATIRREFSQRS
jgi:predicted nucleotide-binding protein